MRSLAEGRFVRLLTALFWITLGMIGCDEREKTVTTTIRSIGPSGTNAVRVTANKASANFQCVESANGDCEFLLLVAECPGTDAVNGRRCRTRPVGEFALAAGESRRIAGLPEGFRFCADYGKKPVAPKCLR